jgi:hypothetical protein
MGLFNSVDEFFFGKKRNPAEEANQYIKQIPGAVKQYYQPYMEAGQRQLPGLEEQYGQLMNNPGQRFNEIGSSFQQSPGFQFALNQALDAANRSAAAGGMAGTPSSQQNAMQLATQLGLQDYYNYMGGATDLYKMGLGGGHQLYSQGQQASSSMADQVAQALAQQGAYQYGGAQEYNQGRYGMAPQILGAFAGGMNRR